jgi:hypothetical protein
MCPPSRVGANFSDHDPPRGGSTKTPEAWSRRLGGQRPAALEGEQNLEFVAEFPPPGHLLLSPADAGLAFHLRRRIAASASRLAPRAGRRQLVRLKRLTNFDRRWPAGEAKRLWELYRLTAELCCHRADLPLDDRRPRRGKYARDVAMTLVLEALSPIAELLALLSEHMTPTSVGVRVSGEVESGLLIRMAVDRRAGRGNSRTKRSVGAA